MTDVSTTVLKNISGNEDSFAHAVVESIDDSIRLIVTCQQAGLIRSDQFDSLLSNSVANALGLLSFTTAMCTGEEGCETDRYIAPFVPVMDKVRELVAHRISAISASNIETFRGFTKE